MYFHSEAHSLCSRKQLARLFHREYSFFAEDVAVFRQFSVFYFGQHLIDDVVDVFVRPALKLSWQGVCSEIGGGDVYKPVAFAVQLVEYFELFYFSVVIKSVSAFAFHRCHTHAAHYPDEMARFLLEVFFRCLSCGAYGVPYASAAFHDAHVAVAFHAPHEFFRTEAAEDEMGVRIDKSGQQYFALRIQCLIACGIAARVVSYIGNDAFSHFHCRIGDNRQIVHILAFDSCLACRRHYLCISYNNVSVHFCLRIYYSIILVSSTWFMEKFSRPR